VDTDLVNAAWFVGWLAALLVLFGLGARLPLQVQLTRLPALAYAWGVVLAAVGVALLANVALFRHDAHLDLTRERTFTPSDQADAVVRSLDRDVTLTYFYQARDQSGRRAKYLVEILGHRSPFLHVRTVDPDKQPRLAEAYGIRLYNAAVVEADGRRIQVASTDDNDIALGILRVLRQRVTTVCFMEGHGEYPFDNFEFHTHLETAQAHTHGEKSSALVQMPGHGAGRFRRALEALGYEVRKIVPATMSAIPPDCATVVAVNPRSTYLPRESELLAAYLAQGGSALLMYDLGFVLEPRLAALLGRLGLVLEQQVVVDPLDHYATDYETVAVTAYEAHPITGRIALTFFPGIRPIILPPAPPGISVTPLFRSSRDSYTRPTATVAEHAMTRDVGAAETARPAHSGPQVLAAAVEGSWAPGKPFRVVVLGDADFVSNSFFAYMANSDLSLAMVRWLVREDRLPAVRPSVPVPPLVLLTTGQMQRIFTVIEVLLPLGVVVLGGLVWWSRR
jgi:hypothetical protein